MSLVKEKRKSHALPEVKADESDEARSRSTKSSGRHVAFHWPILDHADLLLRKMTGRLALESDEGSVSRM